MPIKIKVNLDNKPSDLTIIVIDSRPLSQIKVQIANGGLKNVLIDMEANYDKVYQIPST